MKPSRLLSSPDRWCKFTQARDSDDRPVSVFAPEAVKFDLLGAIARYTGLPTKQSELRVKSSEVWRIWSEDNAKSEYRCWPDLAHFNDTTTWPWLKLALEQSNL